MMHYRFKDRLIFINSGARFWPLNGPKGESIEAPRGWHAVSLDDKGNIWDNFGFRGSKDEFLAAMEAHNPALDYEIFDNVSDLVQAINVFDPLP